MEIFGFLKGGVGGEASSMMKWYSSVEEIEPAFISKVS